LSLTNSRDPVMAV